ncbi:HEAT repeat-containing protein 6 [Clonorchis sinensis]|uniref:HEAT repeat-containing protein 6 n=1 Tax=Clonorchis sinensis TaxID=79923 RepID=G7Y6E6_CLOSI|nr:HEAT repeat-containing protein 6 [Clonorchis sinensis]
MSFGGDSAKSFVMHGEKGPEDITRMDAKKDLGIWLSPNLSFSLHLEKSAQKAFAVLRMIRRTFSRITHTGFQILYGAYVRPLPEYANPVVYSGRTKNVILIERVQRMVAGLKSMDYETRLVVLDLFPLEYRRLRGDLVLTYALFEQGLANRFFTVDPANTRRGHGERQLLNDKNKTDPGNLSESLDPVYQSVNPLGQPGSIQALVQSSGSMAVRHRRGATAERFGIDNCESGTFRLVTTCERWLEKTNLRFFRKPVIVRRPLEANKQQPDYNRPKDLEGDQLFDFLEGLDTFFLVCRERCRFPQPEVHLPGDKAQFGLAVNDLIASLLNTFKRLSQQSRGGSATVHGEVRIFKTLNAISSAIGSILFGNLQLIRKDLLSELTWALLTEANSRVDHQNSNDSHQLYVTLSHLAYFRSVWDKRETNSHAIDKQDFLSEPKLFQALLEVFVTGLKHFESLESAQNASLSGSQSDSCSDFSSSGLSSSEDSSRPVEPEVQRDTNDIAHFTASVKNSSSQDVSHVFHPFPSDVDLDSRRTAADAMESIASGLLIAAGPPATETPGDRPCKGATMRTPHTKRVRGRFVNPDPPVIKSSVRRGPNSQLKAYALAVFCTRRLLDTCRAQITLDVWPTLMCGEQSHSLSASYLRGQLHEALLGCCLTTPYDVSGADRTGAPPPAPDLLSLIHRTADKGIRQMLIDILIYLLSSVGRRFVMAEDLTPHSGSFVPYSVRLAVELRHLHRRILLALSNETRLGLQALLLKALTTLVHITPYQRLQPGLLTSLLPALRQLLHRTSADTHVVDLRAGCLNLLANIVGKVPGPLLEVCQMLSPAVQSDSDKIQTTAHPRSTCQTGTGLSSASVHPSANQFRPPNCWSPTHSRDTFTPCWLVQVCLRLIHPDVSTFAWDSRYSESIVDTLSPDQPLQVRIQALSVLREMVPSYAGFLRPSLPVIQKTLLSCLKDLPENKPLWGATLRFLDIFLPHLANATNEGPDGSVYVYDDCVLTSWWENFVPPILRILQTPQKAQVGGRRSPLSVINERSS